MNKYNFNDTEAALWECYELSGEDTSGGPFKGWHEQAVKEVRAMRKREDALTRFFLDMERLLEELSESDRKR